MIDVKNTRKTYGSGTAAVRALRDASMRVDAGEMVAIMGPSGCGKTTLLYVASGIEAADEGEVWIDGTLISRQNDDKVSQFRLERMGFVFQQYYLIDVLTVLENVALPLIARGMPAREARRMADEALEHVGLRDKRAARPVELSGGQCQRAAIARAVAGRPKIIWADEPTGALDSANAEQVIGLLRKLNESFGTTVVIVTHNRDVAAAAHRTMRMENGRVLSSGSVRDV